MADSSIKRGWRNWKSPKQDSGSSKPSAAPVSGTPIKDADLEFSTKIDTNNFKIKTNFTSAKVNNGSFQRRNFKNIAAKFTMEDREIDLSRYDGNVYWSKGFIDDDYKINDGRAKSVMSMANHTKDRRLAFNLAVIISKLAEDKIGEPTIGEDEWDMPELMLRSITKRNIYQCMHSREREVIVLILDTSPSCEHLSHFYSKIAYLASTLGCLEIYLAPNARLTHKMNPRNGQYEEIFDLENDSDAILCKAHEPANFFNKRVILFFGDYDGRYKIKAMSNNNTVYWFNNDFSRRSNSHKGFNGEIYSCTSEKDFINITRKLR